MNMIWCAVTKAAPTDEIFVAAEYISKKKDSFLSNTEG